MRQSSAASPARAPRADESPAARVSLHRPAATHTHRQHAHVLIGVDLARQARDLAAVRSEQDHGRIAADLEARSLLLRARAVAVDVNGNEETRPVDEILAIEDRGLDLVAGRTPDRAPIQKHRLVLRARRGKGRVDVAFPPGDASVSVGRSHRRGSRRQRRRCYVRRTGRRGAPRVGGFRAGRKGEQGRAGGLRVCCSA